MSREEIQSLASELRVRPDVLEKVVRLLDVLRRLHADDELREAYALKGGTALNIFWLPLPRLSVDIDVNFVGEVPRHALAERRLLFERQVARVPLFGLTERRAALPGFEGDAVKTYTLPELAAGKFSAMVSRTVARDRYDAVQLLEQEPGLLERPEFRLAFTCSMAATREDARDLCEALPPLDAQDIRNKLMPVLREAHDPLARDAAGLARHLNEALAGVPARLVRWSEAERAFVGALTEHGELKPELLTPDPGLQRRIAAQPMLRWKQQIVRQHRGLPPLRGEDR